MFNRAIKSIKFQNFVSGYSSSNGYGNLYYTNLSNIDLSKNKTLTYTNKYSYGAFYKFQSYNFGSK